MKIPVIKRKIKTVRVVYWRRCEQDGEITMKRWHHECPAMRLDRYGKYIESIDPAFACIEHVGDVVEKVYTVPVDRFISAAYEPYHDTDSNNA